MKKNIFLGVTLTCMSLVFTGCAKNNSYSLMDMENSRGYGSDNGDEDEAVNTIQIGSKYRITGPMDELKSAVVGILGSAYWPDTLLSSEELAERTGISENMYDDFLAEYQHTEAGIDMMILVKAKEGQLEAVENYLLEYREILLKIYEQQPQNKAKVSASRIETIDDYVCYVQLGADLTPLEEQGDEEMITCCLEANERALDIIEKQILNDK